MKINILTEEWLPYPAHYRCLFTIDSDIKIHRFDKMLDTLEELEKRDSAKMLELIKAKYAVN